MAEIRCLDSNGESISTGYDFSTLNAGGTSKEKKIAIQNSDVLPTGVITLQMIQLNNAAGNASPLYQELAWQKCPKTLSCPFNFSGEAVSGGPSVTGLTVGTTYYYRVTAKNGIGETAGSLETSVTPDVDHRGVQLSWDKPLADEGGVYSTTGYAVYRSTSSYNYNGVTRIAEIAGEENWSFLDTGFAPSITGLPSENTSGGSGPTYGSAPLSGWSPAPSGIPSEAMVVGVLESGQQHFIFVKSGIPITAASETQGAAGILLTEV